MLATLFLVGSIPFWILVCVWSVFLWAFIENEKPGWATFTAVLFFGALATMGDFNIVTIFKEDWVSGLIVVAGYLIAGIIWSFVKWWRYLTRRKETVQELTAEFLKNRQLDSSKRVPEKLNGDWKSYMRHHTPLDFRSARTEDIWVQPRAADNKVTIVTWMGFWPWSVPWTLVRDPVWRALKFAFEALKGSYDRLAYMVWGNLEAELAAPVTPPPPNGGGKGSDEREPHDRY